MPPLTKEEIIEILNKGRREGFQGKDLTRTDLKNADLAGYDLTRVRLDEANLDGADLTNAHLNLASLTRTSLKGAKLNHAYLSSARMDGALLQNAHLQHALLDSAHMNSANLTGADLTGASLTSTNLSKAILNNANLTGAHMSMAHLNYAKLTGANLTDTILGRADVQGATFKGSNLTPQQLNDTQNGDTLGPGALPANVKAPRRPSNRGNPRALLHDKLNEGMELRLLVEHLTDFYNDEMDDLHLDKDPNHVQLMRQKQKILAEQLLAKAEAYANWDPR